MPKAARIGKGPKHAPVPTVLMVASEPSGAQQAAAVMAEVNRTHPGVRWVGVGSPAMVAEGLEPLFPMEDLAVMGVVEILPALPRILRRLAQLAAWVKAHKPQLVVSVDGQDFSARLAKRLKPLGVPHVHYVAPKVWAWRQGRVHQLKHLYTQLLCNLPFEAPWFATAGLPTTYVGHPMVEALRGVEIPQKTKPCLALLPGSRRGEWVRHWPLMLATYRHLKQAWPEGCALLALPDEQARAACYALAPWAADEGLEVVVGQGRYAAMAQCRAALAKSGTNNLEMAFLNLPAVVCYRMNAITFALAKRLVKVRHISLPNLLLNPPAPLGQAPSGAEGVVYPAIVYPEFVQDAATPQALAGALLPLLKPSAPRKAQQALLAKVRGCMQTPKPAATMVAEALGPYLKSISC